MKSIQCDICHKFDCHGYELSKSDLWEYWKSNHDKVEINDICFDCYRKLKSLIPELLREMSGDKIKYEFFDIDKHLHKFKDDKLCVTFKSKNDMDSFFNLLDENNIKCGYTPTYFCPGEMYYLCGETINSGQISSYNIDKVVIYQDDTWLKTTKQNNKKWYQFWKK